MSFNLPIESRKFALKPGCHKKKNWETANVGAKRIVRFGGGKYHRECPPKPVLEGSDSGVGLVCARSRLKKMTLREQEGAICRWGGVQKPFFGEGVLWYVFPSLSFPTPPLIALKRRAFFANPSFCEKRGHFKGKGRHELEDAL